MIDSRDVLSRFFNGSPETRANAERFMLGGNNEKRYLFGRSEVSAGLARVVDIDGFVDDFTQDKEWLGKPIFKATDIALDSLVVNCVLCIHPVSAHKKLESSGLSNILAFSDLYRHFPEKIRLPTFSVSANNDLIKHSCEWSYIYNSLADEESRKVLSDILKFRLTLDYRGMSGYEFRPEEQYFEGFMSYSNEVFVDAGAFDGETTKLFCSRFPDYRRVYVFEPIADSMIKARANLNSFRDIQFINKGVSDSAGSLCFRSASGSANAVDEEDGDSYIDVVTIDKQIDDRVTFIKMDLEGWERKALIGARHKITTEKPKLAIAVYHAIEDFREVFKYVKSLRPEYKVYLRHYTEGWSETIMYFK